jgi:hypothetical protein
MDPMRFDALTRALTDAHERNPTRRSLMAILAGGLLAAGVLGAPETEAKRRRHKHHHHHGGGGGCTPSCAGKQCDDDGCGHSCGSCDANFDCASGTCVVAANRCSGPTGICNADPTPCGTAATGETCGCEQTVEGNTFCANAGENVCTDVECTSTQDCEDTVGFHFFCQEAKTNAGGQFCGCGFGTATGRVCVAECDNPS